jgi:hypothetical protein
MTLDTRWKPSVTVAAVIERGGRYLLVEEETRDGLRLNNPAGHLEAGESLLQAVVREVLEETACVFTPSHLAAAKSPTCGLPSPATSVRRNRVAPSTTASCVRFGSRRPKSRPAASATAALCSCAACRTTSLAAAIRSIC